MSFQTNATLVASLCLLLSLSGCSTRGWFSGDDTYDYTPGRDGGTLTPGGEIRDSEAIHRATMRPYEVFGKKYYPTMVQIGEKFDGIASWYGPNFHGKKTSNGETYSMHKKTAAHKTLPMNTMVKVTNKRNGKVTVVRINDRGPFVAGRIIDLSNRAAHEVDMVKQGTAPVQLEILGFHGVISAKPRTGEAAEKVTISRFAVQIGAFKNLQGAEIYQRKYQQVEGRYHANVKSQEEESGVIHRVWLEGFRSEEEARDFIDRSGIPGAFVVGD